MTFLFGFCTSVIIPSCRRLSLSSLNWFSFLLLLFFTLGSTLQTFDLSAGFVCSFCNLLFTFFFFFFFAVFNLHMDCVLSEVLQFLSVCHVIPFGTHVLLLENIFSFHLFGLVRTLVLVSSSPPTKCLCSHQQGQCFHYCVCFFCVCLQVSQIQSGTSHFVDLLPLQMGSLPPLRMNMICSDQHLEVT